MRREFEQGKVKKRLKGKQGALRKECFAVDLPEGKENGSLDLDLFQDPDKQ